LTTKSLRYKQLHCCDSFRLESRTAGALDDRAPASRRDISFALAPDAKLVWLDAGHFVLDENAPLVAAEIKAVFTA
jgi:hypothetical protein